LQTPKKIQAIEKKTSIEIHKAFTQRKCLCCNYHCTN